MKLLLHLALSLIESLHRTSALEELALILILLNPASLLTPLFLVYQKSFTAGCSQSFLRLTLPIFLIYDFLVVQEDDSSNCEVQEVHSNKKVPCSFLLL